MSLKHELQVWDAALKAFGAGDHASALARFEEISDSSKILFNMALIHAIDGEHDKAVAFFDRAIAFDNYLAVAYFQSGVSQFLLGRYEAARRDFTDALTLFRNNHTIDYEQLGLKFKLFSCEVRFNLGLALINLGRLDEGMLDLMAAKGDKQSPEHDIIDEAVTDQAVGYTVFSIPVGVLFRPSDTKLRNLDARDYLGKAKVIAATNSDDLFVGFSGTKKLAATAGVTPPDGFVQMTAARQISRPRRSNTGDGRLERSVRDEDVKTERPSALGRSHTMRVAAAWTRSNAVTRSTSTANASHNKHPALPTPPSSTSSMQGEQVFPPPKGLLRARSTSSSLSGSRTPRFPQYKGSARSDGFHVPSRPARPADSLYSPAYSDSLSSRRGRKPAPIAPLAQLDDDRPAQPESLGQPSSRDDPPERVVSWTLLQRIKHERAASSPSALPETPHGMIENGPSTSSGHCPFSFASEAGEIESVDSCAQLTLERHERVARYPTSSLGARWVREERRAGAIQMLASDMSAALQLGQPDATVQVGGGDDAIGQKLEKPTLANPVKIRVKLRFQGETRATNVAGDIALDQFVDKVRRKYGSESSLPIKYRDSDGSLVSIFDEDDWECALDIARERAAGGMCAAKLEIFVGAAES